MTAAGLDSQEAEPGDRFGRYEILARLAAGGMGRVYLARAQGPGGFEKTVALKTIHPDLASRADFVEMFLQEARVAARLDHPNVCRVSDFGRADGTYFIAMEHLVGEPLSNVLRALDRAGAPPSTQTDPVLVRIVADVAEGLHAAHELVGDDGASLELVHRDVSPHNVFVGYDGGVRIVDFGVASTAGRSRTTGAELKGKLAYMAPEQIARGPLDRRVDVWALGVVAWEALSGAGLWTGRSEVELVMSIAQDPATPLRRVRSDVPVELETIVMRALEKDPARRWQTARDFSQALHRWLVVTGEVVGLAEIAAVMAKTFPGGRTQKLAVLDRMKLASSDAPARTLTGPRGRASSPGDAAPPESSPGSGRRASSAPQAETFVGGRPPQPSAPPPRSDPGATFVGGRPPEGAGTFVGSIEARAAGPVARPTLGTASVEATQRARAADAAREVARAPQAPLSERLETTEASAENAVSPDISAPFAAPPIAVVPEHQIVRANAVAIWRARLPRLAGAVAVALVVGAGGWWIVGRPPTASSEIVATPLAGVRVPPAPAPPGVAPALAPTRSAPVLPAPPPTAAALPPPPSIAPAPTLVPSVPPRAAPAPAAPSVSATPPRSSPGPAVSPVAPRADPPVAEAPRERPARTPPIATPPPISSGPGVVVVTTDGGWAEVFEGGASLGSTRSGPLRVELPAGRHTIELRPFGLRAPGAGLTRSVEVEAGSTRRVRVGLEE